jgi:D-ribose pyranose/furanose isomerase RbsD
MSLQQVRFLRYNRNNTRKGNMIHKWCALEKLMEMVQSKTPSIESLKVAQRPKVITAKGLNVENVANFYANLNNFTSFIITTHPTFKIVTNQEHKLDKVVKDGSLKKWAHILCTYYFQRENGCLYMCVSMLKDKQSQLYIFKGKRSSKNYI